MSGENKSAADGLGDMMRLWMEMASHAVEAGQMWTANAASSEALHQNRSNVIKAWSDYWEHFLRSSSFLDAQKQYMTGGVEYRKLVNECLGRLHHELQLASSQDIDQLMRTLRRMGEDQREQSDQVCLRLDNIATRLDNLATRMDTLAQRLDTLENKK